MRRVTVLDVAFLDLLRHTLHQGQEKPKGKSHDSTQLTAQEFATGSYPQGYLNSQAKQATLSTSPVVKHTPTVEDSACALYRCLRCSGLCSACPGRHPGNHPKHSSVTPSLVLPCLECTPGMICSSYSRKRSWWWSILNRSKIKGEPK